MKILYLFESAFIFLRGFPPMTNRVHCRSEASLKGWVPALLLILSLALPTSSATALETTPDLAATATSGSDGGLPVAPPGGKVVFHKRGHAQKQIYILGQNHRSPLTGGNGDKTLLAQMEIYRIGEWLIRNRQVELLLPEGFFGQSAQDERTRDLRSASAGGERLLHKSIDNAVLRDELGDSRTFTNAAILLKSNYGVQLRQTEDKGLYGAVADSFRQLTGQEGKASSEFLTRLDCFQERRTAAMLQKIPAVVEREFQGGSIQSKNAIFIIGMAHIAEIIQFLEKESIALTPSREELLRSAPCELALLKENYGVTVILPHSLAEDEEVLRLTKLLGIISE
jgi:hypothetical protein